MSDEMGSFRVDVEIENVARPGDRRVLQSVLVDTGAELSWFPADILDSLGIQRRKVWHFRQADGTVLSRWTGPAFVYIAGVSATDDVVFGEPGDLILLGSRSLEGLNLRIDPVSRRLIDAGPAPAAAIAWLRARDRSVRHDRQVRLPWPDRFPILLGHDPGHLGDVPEIVHDPGGQQLPQGDSPQAGMVSRQVQLDNGQAPGAELLEICGAEPGELLEQ